MCVQLDRFDYVHWECATERFRDDDWTRSNLFMGSGFQSSRGLILGVRQWAEGAARCLTRKRVPTLLVLATFEPSVIYDSWLKTPTTGDVLAFFRRSWTRPFGPCGVKLDGYNACEGQETMPL